MKVTVVNAMAPFLWGGAEELAKYLVRHLRIHGHDADIFNIPFSWEPYHRLPEEIARLKALRMPPSDQVISLKFPIYLLQADHHRTWLIHQYRQAYDLWGSKFGNIPDDPQGRDIRELIIAEDNRALSSRERLFTISDVVSDRLMRFNGIEAPALKLPLNDPELFVGGEYGDYILAPGRVNDIKRQWLLVEALEHMDPSTRLIVAGPVESESDRQRLERLVEERNLGDRVELDLRFLPRNEIADYVNNCRAVAYVPFEEDAYGYVTMEAFEAGKPVVTVNDSGALLQIVSHEENGQVVAPDAQSLATAMTRYASNAALAEEHGRAGRAMWHAMDISWSGVVSRLLER